MAIYFLILETWMISKSHGDKIMPKCRDNWKSKKKRRRDESRRRSRLYWHWESMFRLNLKFAEQALEEHFRMAMGVSQVGRPVDEHNYPNRVG